MATQYTAGITQGQAWTAAIANQIGAAWETWSPAWTSTGTQPTIGNGYIKGRYMRIQKLVIAQAGFVFGSTTTYGTGLYRWSIPVEMRTTSDEFLFGFGQTIDASAGYIGFSGNAYPISTTTVEWRLGTAYAVMAQGTPFTFAASDQLRYTVIYEAA